MPKTFYTEHEIEDLFKSGVTRLELSDSVVLTGLAYEKAQRLGMELVQGCLLPSDAPVRPYLNRSAPPAGAPEESPSGHGSREVPARPADLSARIKAAVLAKLGGEVDPALLDTIVRRVLDQVKG